MKNYLTILFIAFTLFATAQSDTIRTVVPASESPIVTEVIRTRIPCGKCPTVKKMTPKEVESMHRRRLQLLRRKGAATPQIIR